MENFSINEDNFGLYKSMINDYEILFSLSSGEYNKEKLQGKIKNLSIIAMLSFGVSLLFLPNFITLIIASLGIVSVSHSYVELKTLKSRINKQIKEKYSIEVIDYETLINLMQEYEIARASVKLEREEETKSEPTETLTEEKIKDIFSYLAYDEEENIPQEEIPESLKKLIETKRYNMKAKNINDDNLEINEENYAAYERLMEDYISLTKHPDSKYNLDNNAENFFDKLIFIPITTLIGLVATTSFESPIPFILVSATGILTMIYSLVKYDTIGKNLKQELKKRHPNIDTDVDFQELDSKLYEYVRSTITRNQEILAHEEYNSYRICILS